VTLARLLEDAASLLGSCELVDDLTFSSRAAVVRVRLQGAGTVIIKQPLSNEAYDREIEAMRTLPAAVRPALVATGNGLLAIEDLGSGPSLADLLLGSDAEAAEAALVGWAASLGRALKATLRRGPEEKPERLDAGVHEMRLLGNELGVAVPPALEEDAQRIASILATPGPWLAFCPGDTCPDNNRVRADGSVRLFDFEAAGWRNAAIEAAYCRVPFCTCWCVARLPEGMTQRMEDSFLVSLSPPDRDRFVDTIAIAAVRSTLATFGWFRRFVLDNRPVGPPDRAPCTGRQYVYDRLLTAARERDRLPALADFAARLADRMVRRWPESATMPLYPAFR
jgi:hypothetical protein